MFTLAIMNIFIYVWLFGAIIDMAVRAPTVVDGADSFRQAVLALAWPVKRPLDVLGVIWTKLFG